MSCTWNQIFRYTVDIFLSLYQIDFEMADLKHIEINLKEFSRIILLIFELLLLLVFRLPSLPKCENCLESLLDKGWLYAKIV